MPVVEFASSARAQVLAETWGHLAPTPKQDYAGTIVFAHGIYGDVTIVDVDFAGLPDSPWLFEGVHSFIDAHGTEPGTIYRFTGTYRRTRKGNHRFTGAVTVIS